MAQDSGGLIKWGLVALVGWYVFEHYLSAAPVVAPAPAGGPNPPAPPTPPTSGPANPPPAANPFTTSGMNSLDKVYQALSDKGGATTVQTADDWNWDLMAVVPGFTAPDPVGVFSPINFDPPWTRDRKMPIGQYWLVMSQYLIHNQGLSGLGFYASGFKGLAALYGRSV